MSPPRRQAKEGPCHRLQLRIIDSSHCLSSISELAEDYRKGRKLLAGSPCGRIAIAPTRRWERVSVAVLRDYMSWSRYNRIRGGQVITKRLLPIADVPAEE